MKRTLRIALIGFSTLECLGLRLLAEGMDDVVCEDFPATGWKAEELKDFDGFIADSAAVGLSPEFFVNRVQRLLTIGTGCQNLGNMSDRNSDESEIGEAIGALADKLRTTGTADSLSVREKEVLKLVAEGLINKEIAERLCISVNTVITHRKNIASKLGIKSTSGMSLYAMMHGLLGR